MTLEPESTPALPDHFSSDLGMLSQVFRRFGEVECRVIESPLYERFSLDIAEDREMLLYLSLANWWYPR